MTAPDQVVGTPLPSTLSVEMRTDAVGPMVVVNATRVREGWQVTVFRADKIEETALARGPISTMEIAAVAAAKLREWALR